MSMAIFSQPLSSQLSPTSQKPAFIDSAYPLADATGIRVPLEWSFALVLRSDTCSAGNSNSIQYSASGLPGWLSFDADRRRFYGESPLNPSITVVSLSCSDGTTTVSDSFVIRGQGQLELKTLLPPVISSPRNPVVVDTSSTIDGLLMDGTALTDDQREGIGVFVDSSASWLSWDSTKRIISGTIPEDYISLSNATSLSIPINFTLIDTLPATTTFQLGLQPYIFTATTLPDYHVLNSSQELSLSLWPFVRNKDASFQVFLQPDDANSWISVDLTNGALYGTIPQNISYNTIPVTIYGTSTQPPYNATTTFNIILDPSSSTTAFSPHVSTKQSTIVIALVCVLGVVLLFILTLLFLFRYKKLKAHRQARRRTNTLQSASSSPPITMTNIQAQHHLTPSATNTGTEPTTGPSPRRRILPGRQSDPTRLIPRMQTPPPPQEPSTTTTSWGPEIPRPPPNLSEEETRAWVDAYVTDWSTQYRQSQIHSRPRGWDGLPNTTAPHALLPPHQLHLHPNQMRSQTDLSSIASWESLDSWEVERRANYQSPRRRPDFGGPRRSRSLEESANQRASRLQDQRGQEEQEETGDVFFPRPIGSELPGTGMARSPHLEGLSRFGGISDAL